MNRVFEQALVINLEQDRARLYACKKQLDSLGIKLIRIPACHGASVSKDEIYKNTTTLARRFLAPGVIGCALSHKKVWSYIVENKLAHALVLEDDALFNANTNELFNKIWPCVPSDWEIVYFHDYGNHIEPKNMSFLEKIMNISSTKFQKSRINNHCYIPKFSCCTHAMAITYTGAQKLLKIHDKIEYMIDLQMSRKMHLFKFYCINPSLITQDFSTSTINNISVCREAKSKLAQYKRLSICALSNTMCGWKNVPLSFVMNLPFISILGRYDLTLQRILYVVVAMILGFLAADNNIAISVIVMTIAMLLYTEHLMFYKKNFFDPKQWQHLLGDFIMAMFGILFATLLSAAVAQ